MNEKKRGSWCWRRELQSCFYRVLSLAIIVQLASFSSESRADELGPETEIRLPKVSADELKAAQLQLFETLPKVKACCVRIKGNGSGVIIGSDGLVLTHGHCSERPGAIYEVTLADGQTRNGMLLGVHRRFDIGLVRIQGEGPWPFLDLCPATQLKTGQFAFGYGHPVDFAGVLGNQPLLRFSRITEIDPTCIYSAIPVRPGDSGGPLFNLDGAVIGIFSGTDAHENGFSVFARADLLHAVRDTLLQNREVTRAQSTEFPGPQASTSGRVAQDDVPYGDSRIPPAMLPAGHSLSQQQLEQLDEKLESVRQSAGSATVVIISKKTGKRVGCGVIVSSAGRVLTHGSLSPKFIGPKFDVLLQNGERTTGTYLGVHKGRRLAVMQLEGDRDWPFVDIGNPSKMKPPIACAMVSYPGNAASNQPQPPSVRGISVLALSGYRLHTAIDRLGQAGAPLFSLDGKLLGIKDRSSRFARADFDHQTIKPSFTPKYTYPYPFGGSRLESIADSVSASLLKVICDDKHVASGFAIERGFVLTKASLLRGEIRCETIDGQQVAVSLIGRSVEHDIALLKSKGAEIAPIKAARRDPPQQTIVLSVSSVSPAEAGGPFGAGIVGRATAVVPPDKGQLGFQVGPADGGDKGVVVTKVLFALSKQFLNQGDVIFQFGGKPVDSVDRFREVSKDYLASNRGYAGELVPVRVRRGESNRVVYIPIERGDEGVRPRRLGEKTAPLLPDGLQGRHSGFPNVFVHDALPRIRTECDAIQTPHVIDRRHLGSPVVNLEGEFVGINIGNHIGAYSYAVPISTVSEAIQEIDRQLAVDGAPGQP